MAVPELTRKQELFCQEYLVDLSATHAAIRAGYSEKSASVIGHENLSKPYLAERIAELFNKRTAKAGITADYVLGRLVQMDKLDIIDIVTDDLNEFKPLSEWPKEWRTSISGIDISTIVGSEDIPSVIKKIKWPDKVKNLELIGKHVDVRAFEKDAVTVNNVQNIMPTPSADNIDDWEQAAQAQQDKILNDA